MSAILNLGTWLTLRGIPEQGYAVLCPVDAVSGEAVQVLFDAGGNTIFSGPEKVYLQNGTAQATLPANDDLTIQPIGFAWNVVLFLDGEPQQYEATFDLPDGTTVFFTDQITLPTGSGVTYQQLISEAEQTLSDLEDISFVVTDHVADHNNPHIVRAAQLSDFDEAVQDAVGTMLVSGGNITLAYNDTTGQVTISSTATTGGAGADAEVIRDTIGAALVGVNGVSIVANDSADTITFNISGLTIAQTTGLQANLDAKAPIASPTFTGTVAGVTKAMVGLTSVDNTSDAAKPVSTATQTALNLKANLSLVNLVDNTADIDKPVSTAQQSAILAVEIPISQVNDSTSLGQNLVTAVSQAAAQAILNVGGLITGAKRMVTQDYATSGSTAARAAGSDATIVTIWRGPGPTQPTNLLAGTDEWEITG